MFNTLRPEQNGYYFADDMLKYIILNENYHILIQISMKFVPKNQLKICADLFPVMAWCQVGDKLLPELMMTLFTDT